MDIISCQNQKGGVGKTLTATLLSEYFSIVKHKSVLLIDLDMQCNTTDQFFGMERDSSVPTGLRVPVHPEAEEGEELRSSIADIFYGEGVVPYPTWVTTGVAKGGRVDLLCGDPNRFEEINSFFCSKADVRDRVLEQIKTFLRHKEVEEAYDYVILDTGPSRSPIFRAAMRAATHIIIPFKPETKDLQGISLMNSLIQDDNVYRSSSDFLRLVGLLPNMVRLNTGLHRRNLEAMTETYGKFMFPKEAWLSELTAFPERDVIGTRPKSIFELPASNKARRQAMAMCKFVEERVRASSDSKVEQGVEL